VSVYLLNVPAVGEKGAKALEAFVKDGGGVGFFLGPNVKPAEYNRWLYDNGNGVFPVQLPDKPTEPLTEEQLNERRLSFNMKLMVKDTAVRAHPALRGMYLDEQNRPNLDVDKAEKIFRFVTINQYWPVKRLGKWRDDKSVTELMCMPNDSPMSAYDGAAQAVANALPVDEAKYAKFKPILEKMRSAINITRNSAKPLYEMADLLDRLLTAVHAEGDPDEALLREFWANPETADLKAQVARLRDNVKFGDPLYIAKDMGRGRVTVVTTTSGEQWTDWPSNILAGAASFTWVVKEMANYLAGGGTDANLTLGDPLTLRFDSKEYKPSVRQTFLSHDGLKEGVKEAEFKDQGELTLVSEKDQFPLTVNPTEPGVAIYTLTQVLSQAAGEGTEVPEYRAFAFNVDTVREGDLKRVSRDDLAQYAPMGGENPAVQLHAAADKAWTEQLKNKRRDLSDLTVLFLILLLVLIGEQALAVRLSYHARDDQLASEAPSAAALFHRGTAATAPAAAEPEPELVG
jgi:hypothetical protein